MYRLTFTRHTTAVAPGETVTVWYARLDDVTIGRWEKDRPDRVATRWVGTLKDPGSLRDERCPVKRKAWRKACTEVAADRIAADFGARMAEEVRAVVRALLA